jgi:hypothetical protein
LGSTQPASASLDLSSRLLYAVLHVEHAAADLELLFGEEGGKRNSENGELKQNSEVQRTCL